MSQHSQLISVAPPFPDHNQLPSEDGTFVKNFQEHPQSIILTDSLGPILAKIHPDGQYAIGQDCGIYWRETEPPEKGAECPDWFYVPNVPPLLNGEIRRSYVLWREHLSPLVALEFASGNGDEERDCTPISSNGKQKPGKFWVYEQIIHIPYYGIYEITNQKLEVYHLVDGMYHLLAPNERGHYPIGQLGVELGLWAGNYQNQYQCWLRWWDLDGNLLLTGTEQVEIEKQRVEVEKQRVEVEKQRAEAEKQRAETEKQRADSIEQSVKDSVPKLLSMGLTIEQVAQALSLSTKTVQDLSNC